MADPSTSAAIISLPKGGGAQQGLGEKFSPDLHTGTGNFSVPIAIPAGRNGFQPQLNLVYSTGNGNGCFGLGWNLSVPGVTRKTSKGIPRYQDGDQDSTKRDVFVLSGAEDLVPVSDASLDPAKATRYRPRTEGLFARIIHHHDTAVGTNYWEVSSKEGLISYYGSDQPHSTAATIYKPKINPADQHRIFAWKLTLTKDSFGNRIEYLYEKNDRSTAQDERAGHEWSQPLLTQIRYVDFEANNEVRFLITVSFDYEDRPDPFSDYRAGFEIRTSQRCRSIRIETHAGQPRAVRNYVFAYDNSGYNAASLLRQIDVTGFDDAGNCYDGQIHNGEHRERQLPSLEFGYTHFDPTKRKFEVVTGPDLPVLSVGNSTMEMVDLHGAGLPDILEMNGAPRYWRNLGQSRFDIPSPMTEAPAGFELSSMQLLDADGDGRTDLMISGESLAGYFPLQFPAKWSAKSFQRYRYAPTFSLRDPEVKLLDLDGDGVTDALRSGTRLECFFNDARSGWNPGNVRWVDRQSLDVFPNVNFSDSRVKFADMTGDGMQDIVLVHSGNVEYWPNLGYGNWARRIHMTNSPRFPNGYDPRRILIGDVDGDGLADIVYVDHREVYLWINQGGNGWADPIVIKGTPPVVDVDGLRLVDLLGSGISGVLWSTDVGKLGPRNLMFLDFTGGIKPYLLDEMDNNLGALTRIEYKPSTHFYLEDEKTSATRWRTPLPFPVQVVAKVEIVDEISRGRLTTEYRYHHGYWDGAEREFRGFGMVEQFDSESFSQYAGVTNSDRQFEAVSQIHFSPPTLTKTWFHLGPVGPEFGDWQEDLDWSNEFWPGDRPLLDHNEFVTPFLRALAADNPQGRRIRRDAIRSLRGTIIRTEVYAIDGSPNADRPYIVTESQYALAEIDQPAPESAGRPRIFFPHLRGQRTTQWERGDDPLTVFVFSDDYDDAGQPQQATSIACPRGWRSMADRPSSPYLATRSTTRYASPAAGSSYILDRVASNTTFELTNTAGATINELRTLAASSNTLKTIAQTLNYYDGSEFRGLDGPAFAGIGRYGALTHTEQLVFTDEHLSDALRDTGIPVPPWLDRNGPNWTSEYPASFQAAVPALGGYVFYDGTDGFHAPGYFATTVAKAFDFQRSTSGRGLVLAQRDPLGHETAIDYDSFDLLPVKVTDPHNLEVNAIYNLRLLQTEQVIDINGNRAITEYNPIGSVSRTWTRGKRPGEGDSPARAGVEIAYDLRAFEQRGEPISIRTLRYEQHDQDPEDTGVAIETREYSDGFGRLIQTRTQAEDVRFGDPVFGLDILPADVTVRPGPIQLMRRDPNSPPNVVVSGWQVYDNKGRVVEKYEPFFDRGWDHGAPGNAKLGQKVSTFYDPRGRVVRTVNPDGSEQHVIFGKPNRIDEPPLSDRDTSRFLPTPWEAFIYDGNDNAGRTHANNSQSYRHHWDTPANTVIDALGRTIVTTERNRTAPGEPVREYRTRTTHDILGNAIAVTDRLGRTASEHKFDLANRRLRLDSIDAGLRITFFDVVGNLVETRDGKGALTLRAYDRTNRPTHVWARDDSNEKTSLREKLEYGEQVPDRDEARARNVLGKLFQHYDEAGKVTFEHYDFKGNVQEKVRKIINPDLLAGMTFRVDWEDGDGPELATSEYRTNVSFDALNRIRILQCPEDVDEQRKRITLAYNSAGALESVDLDGDVFVERIAYNAKGQRALTVYGNGILTAYEYDRNALRLRRMWTSAFTRTDDERFEPVGKPQQNAAYAYDLVGNVMMITEFVSGCGVRNNADALRYPQLASQLVAGDAMVRRFEYDALYRLISATGRESDNIQSAAPWPDGFHPNGFNWGTPAVPNPNNARDQTRMYVQTCDYDPVDNIIRLSHNANGMQWARNFGMSRFTPAEWTTKVQDFLAGASPSWGAEGNRLTNFGSENEGVTHRFDANGNLIQEFSNRMFEWDHSDRLRGFRELDAAGNAGKEARYVYGSSGSRVIKRVLDHNTITVTIYIDGIFEHLIAGPEQTNTIHIMDSRARIANVRVGPALNGDTGPKVQYHLADQLRSSNIVIGGATASAADFYNREEFYPHGETSFGSFSRKRFRFAGNERDSENGLYYHETRYYQPFILRWASCDPLGSEVDVNLYSFNRGNPVRFMDPNGMQPVDIATDGGSARPEPPASTESSNTSALNYSNALSAERKEEIDKKIAASGIKVDPDSPEYWRAFVKEISEGKVEVSPAAKGLQFFLISGGREGFMQSEYKNKNADAATFNAPADKDAGFDLGKIRLPDLRFNSDVNDALVIFDRSGKELVAVFQLVIPNSVGDNNGKTENVLRSWNNKTMVAYKNTEYGYRGLTADPSQDQFKKKGDPNHWWVDIHKMFVTEGCVEISPVDRSGNRIPENKSGEIKPLEDLFNRFGVNDPGKYVPLGTIKVLGYEQTTNPSWLRR